MHTHEDHWRDAQHEEKDWWGDCANTYWEETKQLIYANRMGIDFTWDEQGPYNIDKKGLDILDIGGGPSSLLLKTKGFHHALVADPCEYPEWVAERYKAHGVDYIKTAGEDLNSVALCDEVWMYNVLQHTKSPEKIIKNAMAALKPGGIFRIFEWVNHPTNTAHPHSLSPAELREWIGQKGGAVEFLNENGCHGEAFYGAFKKGE